MFKIINVIDLFSFPLGSPAATSAFLSNDNTHTDKATPTLSNMIDMLIGTKQWDEVTFVFDKFYQNGNLVI